MHMQRQLESALNLVYTYPTSVCLLVVVTVGVDDGVVVVVVDQNEDGEDVDVIVVVDVVGADVGELVVDKNK